MLEVQRGFALWACELSTLVSAMTVAMGRTHLKRLLSIWRSLGQRRMMASRRRPAMLARGLSTSHGSTAASTVSAMIAATRGVHTSAQPPWMCWALCGMCTSACTLERCEGEWCQTATRQDRAAYSDHREYPGSVGPECSRSRYSVLLCPLRATIVREFEQPIPLDAESTLV